MWEVLGFIVVELGFRLLLQRYMNAAALCGWYFSWIHSEIRVTDDTSMPRPVFSQTHVRHDRTHTGDGDGDGDGDGA